MIRSSFIFTLALTSTLAASAQNLVLDDGFEDGQRQGRTVGPVGNWFMLQRAGEADEAGTLEVLTGLGFAQGNCLERSVPARAGKWRYSSIMSVIPGSTLVMLPPGDLARIRLSFDLLLVEGYNDVDGLRLGLYDGKGKQITTDHMDGESSSFAGYWATIGMGQNPGIGLRKEIGGKRGITQGDDVKNFKLMESTAAALMPEQMRQVVFTLTYVENGRTRVELEVREAGGSRVAHALAIDDDAPLRRFDHVLIGDRPTEGKAVRWRIDNVRIETMTTVQP